MRDFNWITRNLRSGERAELIDVTSAFSIIGVMGPNARALLSRLTDADLSNANFPFLHSKQISLGHATVRAARITYVGELGWDLHVPVEQAALVLDTLMATGADLGVVNARHYANNSLRLEKGHRAWGAELSSDDTPLEAGLEFAIDWKKDFLGRDALLQQKQAGVERWLVLFVLDDPGPVLWGSEPIYRDHQIVGYTTSGSHGHAVGGAIAMGYVKHTSVVTSEFIHSGRHEINIAGQRYPAKAYLRAPYDPERRKILS